MTTRFRDPLLFAGKAIAIFMQGAMAVGALALAVGFFGVIFFTPQLAAEAGLEPFPADFPIGALAALMLIGLAIVAMMFFFFDKLRRIIGTVGEGDPFHVALRERQGDHGEIDIGARHPQAELAHADVDGELHVGAAAHRLDRRGHE